MVRSLSGFSCIRVLRNPIPKSRTPIKIRNPVQPSASILPVPPSSPICHPFSDSIMSARLPEQIKLPVIEKYDGLSSSSDAKKHLAKFKADMLFYGDIITDPIMCRAFPTTLTGDPLCWFFTLPPKSIHNFSELSQKFLDADSFLRKPPSHMLSHSHYI